jgi:hypothetical protein
LEQQLPGKVSISVKILPPFIGFYRLGIGGIAH